MTLVLLQQFHLSAGLVLSAQYYIACCMACTSLNCIQPRRVLLASTFLVQLLVSHVSWPNIQSGGGRHQHRVWPEVRVLHMTILHVLAKEIPVKQKACLHPTDSKVARVAMEKMI